PPPAHVAEAREGVADWASYVDPFIGTGGHGHTYPGATVPFGMVQLSPDTSTDGWDRCSGYHQDDTTLEGFSHTHLSGTGACDMGAALFCPTVGAADPGARARFSPAGERAAPGDYRVRLVDSGIDVELTATKPAGFHRYTFPATREADVLVDLGHGIQ